jgi:hypothetical protein
MRTLNSSRDQFRIAIPCQCYSKIGRYAAKKIGRYAAKKCDDYHFSSRLARGQSIEPMPYVAVTSIRGVAAKCFGPFRSWLARF